MITHIDKVVEARLQIACTVALQRKLDASMQLSLGSNSDSCLTSVPEQMIAVSW